MDRLNPTRTLLSRAIVRVAAAIALGALTPLQGCASTDRADDTDHAQRTSASTAAPPVDVVDGRPVQPLDGAAGTLVALVFISHECPIANAMAPDLRALAAHAAEKGVAMHLVHPSPWVTRDELLRHAREFGFVSGTGPDLSVLADPSQTLLARCGASITPEGALIRLDGVGGGEVLYVGRVNDLYVAIGRRRPSVSSHDLRDAIDAAVAGRAIAQPFPKAVGCFIESSR